MHKAEVSVDRKTRISWYFCYTGRLSILLWQILLQQFSDFCFC